MADDATEPTEHPEALGSAPADATVDDKLAHLDKTLTQRINKLRSDLSASENATDGRVGDLERKLRALGTQVQNNADAIGSFTTDINDVKKLAAQLRTQAAQLEQHVERVEQAESAKDAELEQSIAEVLKTVHDVSQGTGEEIAKAEKRTTDLVNQTRSDLSQRIQAVADAPVKPHTHTFHLDGSTSSLVQGKGDPE